MRTNRLALLALPLLLAACGGSASSGERALTQDEADRLASVLFTNYEAKGASFELATSFTTTGDALSMRGIVDWTTHRGSAIVSARGQEEGVTEVVWSDTVVIERRPQLDAPLETAGHPGARWVARPPDPKTRQIDHAISVLVGLASTVRDNGILVLQKAGSAFVRKDSWRGEQVEVMRYGSQNRFWLEPGTSNLRRFDGNTASGSAPIIIDFGSFGRRPVAPPPRETIVNIDEVRDVYPGATQD